MAWATAAARRFRTLIRHAARIRYRLLLINVLVAAVPLVGISFAQMHESQLLGARFQAAVKRLGLNKIRYRLDTLRFAVPDSARTALVDAKRDARQMKLL